jgi:hypothetical protein
MTVRQARTEEERAIADYNRAQEVKIWEVWSDFGEFRYVVR